jgi:hypothetical protein
MRVAESGPTVVSFALTCEGTDTEQQNLILDSNQLDGLAAREMGHD